MSWLSVKRCLACLGLLPVLVRAGVLVTSESSPLRQLKLSTPDDPIYYTEGYGDLCVESTCAPPLFCGSDSMCHARTCENIYAYAPYAWTGRNGTTGVEDLECFTDEFPDTVEPPCKDVGGLFPVAVHYSCYRYGTVTVQPSTFCSTVDEIDADGNSSGMSKRFAPMNRVCTAKPNKEQRFICYDIAPDTNLTSYFDEYLEAVEEFAGCKDETSPTEGNSTFVAYGHEISSSLVFERYNGDSLNLIYDASFKPLLSSEAFTDMLPGAFEPTTVADFAIQVRLIADPSPMSQSTPAPVDPSPTLESTLAPGSGGGPSSYNCISVWWLMVAWSTIYVSSDGFSELL